MNNRKEKVIIGLENVVPDFKVVDEVLGPNGSNLKYILDETGTMVTLRGRGSGFFEVNTGKELDEPLHLCIEHQSSRELFLAGRRLAFNLIETIQQDCYEKQKIPNNLPIEGGGGWSMRGSRYEQQSNSGGRNLERAGVQQPRNSSREDFTIERQGSTRRTQVQTDGSRIDGIRNSGSHFREQMSDQRSEGSRFWDEQSEQRNVYRDETLQESGRFRGNHFQHGSGHCREDSQDSAQFRDVSLWQQGGGGGDDKLEQVGDSFGEGSKTRRGGRAAKRRKLREAYQQAQHVQVQVAQNRKSRWDNSSPLNSTTAVSNSAVPLDQKKSQYDVRKLKRAIAPNELPKCSWDGQAIPNSTIEGTFDVQGAGVINPLHLDQLQRLNRRQLLQVSHKQQELLIQLANLAQQTHSDSGPSLQPTEISRLDENPNELSWQKQENIREGQGNYLSDDEMSNRGSSPCGEMNSGWKRKRHSTSPSPTGRGTMYEYNCREAVQDKEMNPPLWSETKQNSVADDWNPYREMEERFSCRHEGAGGERYSPQLGYDYTRETLNKRSSRVSSSPPPVGSTHRWSPEDDRQDKQMSKLLRYRVGVVRKDGCKLTSDDSLEIRFLVSKGLSTLPSDSLHKINIAGLTSNDYLFVLMPLTLKGMQWLVKMAKLSSGSREYVLLPYDDIYNRYRFKATVFYDTLDGYQLTRDELVLDLGRNNEGLNIQLWKIIKFNREDRGYFVLVSVDLLSYLQLKKLGWKPKFRTGYIKLRPTKAEKDKRF